jgi:hypothetical protein
MIAIKLEYTPQEYCREPLNAKSTIREVFKNFRNTLPIEKEKESGP